MGKISWKQAAAEAQEVRNIIMSMIRDKSTPIGKAMAQALKSEGKTLNELIAKKTQAMFGKDILFDALKTEQKNSVYSEIVKSAGKSNPKVNLSMQRLSSAGRGLIFLSVGVSVYNVVTAEDKVKEAAKEVTVTGGGIVGGMAGGALAGLACGPGAPICVTVGVFIGGGLAAFGVSALW